MANLEFDIKEAEASRDQTKLASLASQFQSLSSDLIKLEK